MAKTEVQSKKRKGAAEPSVSATKKVKTTPEKTEKSKTLRSAMKKAPVEKKSKEAPAPAAAAAVAVAVEKKPTKPARKRAEDFLEEKTEKTVKKAAPAKKTTATAKVVEAAPAPVAAKESAAAKTKGKKTAAKPVEKEVTATVDDEEEGSDDDEEEDDHTAALLAGFDSSEDENDPEDDDKGVPMDKLPAIPDEKNTRKQLKSAQKDDADNKPGVLYVGRIPHGFFEHQMRAYFSQFGDITHLRLSRNKVTGRSKHYAFIEFASASVADIVAKTMDKYLLFGHLLQVRRIPAEQVHAQLWKGEGRRFKVMPRNKIEGGLLNKGKTREQWEKKIKKEEQKREKEAAKLKEIGYEFDMPALKSVDDVPMKDAVDGEGVGLLDGGEVKAILEKQPEAEKVEIEKPEAAEKVNITAGTKRVKVKGDGKKAKKAKVTA